MDEYLIDTQTPELVENSSQATQECNVRLPWGKLIAAKPALESVDLVEPSYSVGRALHCSISFYEKQEFEAWNCISKEHLTLSRDETFIYLTDTSKNGTFVNQEKITKGNKYILKNGDSIALGQVQSNAYILQTNISGDARKTVPPDIVKKYCVMELLGKGACGEVNLAYNRKTLQQFALKSIVKGRSTTSPARINHPQKIACEIRILSTIRHPFLIQMHEVVETPEEVFLFLEYMKGGELKQRIVSMMPFPETEIKFIAYQIALGVKYLHNNGITHRDLKPQNILLSSDNPYPHVKITDFGLSKIMEGSCTMVTTCGTLLYAAPEVLCGNYTSKVDVWSLGVILYYMIVRNLPFQGEGRELYLNIRTGQVSYDDPVWRTISANAKDLVKKMLVVDPKKRLSIEGVVAHPWFSADLPMQMKVERLLANDESSSDPFAPDSSTDLDPLLVKRRRLTLSDDVGGFTSSLSD